MLPLHQLLFRFKNLVNTEKVKKEIIVELFKKNNIPLTITQISFNKTTIFLKIPPLVKTEVFLKKKFLLEEIRKNESLIYFSDIQ